MTSARVRGVVVLLAALVTAGVTARLGLWQLDRAAQKLAIQADLDARAAQPAVRAVDLAQDKASLATQRHRPVEVAGEWRPSATVFLENRQMHGQPGFFVVTPLQLEGSGDAVLVQRGWAPRDLLDRRKVPEVPAPKGRVVVAGQVADPPGRLLALGSGEEAGSIRQNLDLDAFAREQGLRLRPLSIVQADRSPAAQGDGLRRDWPAPAVDVQKHHGYAFQWFALSALTTGLYVWFQLVRPRRARRTA